MFKNFKTSKVNINGVRINFKIGGKGYPILMLHGYPQTHMMWRKLATKFTDKYTVICPDLRGYGDSDKPISDKLHKNYSLNTKPQ